MSNRSYGAVMRSATLAPGRTTHPYLPQAVPPRLSLATAAALLLAGSIGLRPAGAQTTVRVTLGPSLGRGADGPSDTPSISADGRFVAFTSRAGNILPGGVEGRQYIYVRDRLTGSTVRASVAPDGSPADADCFSPAISGDGRRVAFESRATNLAPGASGASNIFVRDLDARTTACASLPPDGAIADGGAFAPFLSTNGRFVAFESNTSNLVPGDTNDQYDVFLHDLLTHTTTRVSVPAGDGQSNAFAYAAAVSGDGRVVAFVAGDGNLVADDHNGQDDLFVRDTVAGTTVLASAGIGAEADGSANNPSLSADGRIVAFASTAGNLVAGDTNAATDVFVRDLTAGTTECVSVATGGAAALGGNRPSISADGRLVSFLSKAPDLTPGDDNEVQDVFLRDRDAHATMRVSVTPGGAAADGATARAALSADGSFLAFSSSAANLVANDANNRTDVFVRDLAAGVTDLASVAGEERPTPADSDTAWASVSGDGRYVAFYSGAANLVPGDTNGIADTFVRDTWLNTTERVSVATGGAQANGANPPSFGAPGISADGRYVAFVSSATNLVPNDTNGVQDVFVRDRVAGTTARVSVASTGEQANADAGGNVWNSVAISATGRYVLFVSSASNLVADDTNKDNDLFLRDTEAGTTERVNLTPAGGESQRGVLATFPSISADGRYVAFDSSYDLIADTSTGYTRSFVRDRVAHTTIRLPANAFDGDPAHEEANGVVISADGEHVTFTAYIVPVPDGSQPARGVYVLDLPAGAPMLVSRVPGGGYPNDGSWYPAISADGRFVAFYSYASNLAPGDTNGHTDIFRWDRATDTLARVNPALDGGQANADCSDVGISGDGRFVTFASIASNLVPGDTNTSNDIFLRGPLPSADPPYGVLDVRGALGILGGLLTADASALRRLNVALDEVNPNVIEWRDVVLIARKAAGLEPNP